MSLRERAEKSERGIPGPPCSVRTALDRLPPDDAEFAVELLAVPVGAPERRSNPQLADLLADELGIPVSEWSVMRHRNRRCKCYHRGHTS